MTTAVCIFCGRIKFGAWSPCPACGKNPGSHEDRAKSLLLTDQWLSKANASLQDLRAIQLEMQADSALGDPGIRNTVEQMVEIIKEQNACLTALQFAVANGDSDAETKAQEAIGKASEKRRKFGLMLIDKLRRFMPACELETRLRENAANTARLFNREQSDTP